MQSHGGRITARSAANPAKAVQAVAAFAAWLALEVPALGMNPALDDPPWDAYRERSRRDSEASLNTLRAEAAAAGLSSPLRPAKGKSGLPAAPDDPEWWKSEEARRLVDSTLSFQVPTGGWSKGLDFDRVPRRPGEAFSPDDKETRSVAGTVDNRATTAEIRFLAHAASATGRPDCVRAVGRGLEFLLTAQYPNGGWPQFYPLIGGYHDCVTLNDDAMAHVLELLFDMSGEVAPFGFLTDDQRRGAAAAHARGVACAVAAQVEVDGTRTGWCAQYEARSLRPARGRAYEPAALASAETARLMRVLMEIPDPPAAVVEAVEAAGRWLESVRLAGVKVEKRADPELPKGLDRVVVADPAAPALWARFYEVPSMRPVFCREDGQIRFSLAEIDHGRRIGYDWYVDNPREIIGRQWPAWRAARARAGRAK
jgi:PelA/Pel-15E family pectate lyase